MANWEQLNFQDGLSPLMEQLYMLHDHIMSILVLITMVVLYSIFYFLTQKKMSVVMSHNHSLETIWTMLPASILFMIAFPSLRLLYMSEEQMNSPLSIKTMGHQWYWSYEYSNFKDTEFDAFMKNENYIFRLLETDNFLVLPTKSFVQMFTSSTDVLHSWTVPLLGVKADSAPGRLNIINFLNNKAGIHYGQCSEICGANHSFMPISLLSIPFKKFLTWINLSSLKSLLH